MIFLTAIPLTKKAGRILMQTAPEEIDIKDVKEDIEMIPGVDSVHELHIWKLDQRKSIASAHIVVDNGFSGKWLVTAKTILECFHAYGIHSVTLQPETTPSPRPSVESPAGGFERPPAKLKEVRRCQILCNISCCGTVSSALAGLPNYISALSAIAGGGRQLLTIRTVPVLFGDFTFVFARYQIKVAQV
ncbi:hypothetical protein MY4824_003578 [Beauveria thailandica]